jgi:hypothetical protein
LRAVAGRRSQFSLDIAAPVTTSHGTSQDAAIAEFDFSCAYSIIARTSNSWHPSKPGTDRNSFAVTKLAQLQAKWDVTDTRRGDPYCRPNEFPALLAIQGIVTFSDLMERAPDNSKSVFALTMQEYAFLQEVRVAGSGTDDRFLSLPLADTLRTTMMSVEAWNMIVDRVSRDSLTLQQTMALTISASIDIYYRNQWFDGDHASTDYNEALSTLDEIAACCIDSFAIRGRSKGGSREHLVDWYSRWIPAHWHEAVFDADQIRAWTSRLMVTVGPIDPESSGFSGFVYAGDLASRVRIASEEAGTAEQIARWRWMGGYRTYVDTAALTDLPSTFRSALCKEYQEHQTRIALGGFAAREIHADYLEAPSGPPPGHAKRSSADEKFDQALTDYTVQRLQRWKRS